MADRKVLNKYFPPDFDPTKLWKNKRFLKQQGPRQKGPKAPKQMQMRMMFPFTLCCSRCNEFVYVGTKFNSRVEKVQGEDYLGVEIWRFYGRCPNCRSEIAFKTDPKNGDYTLEFGGVRTYDAAKDTEKAESLIKEQAEMYLEGDRMKQVEAKTYNTQQELQTLEDLEEIRQINKRFLDRDASVQAALQYVQSHSNSSQSILEEEEEAVKQFRSHVEEWEEQSDDDSGDTTGVTKGHFLSSKTAPVEAHAFSNGKFVAQQSLATMSTKFPKLTVKRKAVAVVSSNGEHNTNNLFGDYISDEEEEKGEDAHTD